MNSVTLFILAGQKKVISGPDLARGSLVADLWCKTRAHNYFYEIPY